MKNHDKVEFKYIVIMFVKQTCNALFPYYLHSYADSKTNTIREKLCLKLYMVAHSGNYLKTTAYHSTAICLTANTYDCNLGY